MKPIKVSELNKYIKKYISMDYLLNDVSVEGEISNLKHHSNGNYYFSLKDEYARINTIMFEEHALNLPFTPYDGMKIIGKGSVSFYESQAQINFYVQKLEKIGQGDLFQRFLTLKEKLEKEGLFDSDHKKELQSFPGSVGIVTSDTGAAVKDIVNIIKEKNKLIDIVIYPSLVQGHEAAKGIAKGIEFFNQHPVDTIIIGRGGGSFEDLFAFNDEDLARKIYASNIPIISAVGHEVDFSISDFVADKRAATPTKAAEMVTVSYQEIEDNLKDKIHQLTKIMVEQITENREEIYSRGYFLKYLNPKQKIVQKRYEINSANTRLEFYLTEYLKREKSLLEKQKTGLQYLFRSFKPAADLLPIKNKLDAQLIGIKKTYDGFLEHQGDRLKFQTFKLWEKLRKEKYFIEEIKRKLVHAGDLSKILKDDLQRQKDKLDQIFYLKIMRERGKLQHRLQSLNRSLVFSRNRRQYMFHGLDDKFQALDIKKIMNYHKRELLLRENQLHSYNPLYHLSVGRESLDQQYRLLNHSISKKLSADKNQLEIKYMQLQNIYKNINRVVVLLENGEELSSVEDLTIDEEIRIMCRDGIAYGRILKINKMR